MRVGQGEDCALRHDSSIGYGYVKRGVLYLGVLVAWSRSEYNGATPAKEWFVRLTMILGFLFLVACSDGTDPGDPRPLTGQSLEGRWVRIQVVLATTSAPVVSDTTQIRENGEIFEFTDSGDVEYFCRCPGFDTGPTPQYTSYSISGDTLSLHQIAGGSLSQVAEVTTRRLILRSIETFPVDITGDGVPEDVTVTDTYRRD